jgi:hypothetical protein
MQLKLLGLGLTERIGLIVSRSKLSDDNSPLPGERARVRVNRPTEKAAIEYKDRKNIGHLPFVVP